MCVREYSNVITVNYTLRWVVADFWWTLRLCSPQQTNRPMRTHSNQSVREMSCSTTCSFRTVLSVKNIGCWARNLTAVRLDQCYYTSRTDGQMNHTIELSGFLKQLCLIPSQGLYLCTTMISEAPAADWCDGSRIWTLLFEHYSLSHLLIIWAIFITLWIYCSHSWRVLFTPLKNWVWAL